MSGKASAPYYYFTADFGSENILAGDSVRYTIDYGGAVAFDQTVQTLPISAVADLGANQVTGVGPANTPMVIGVGNVQGYVTSNSIYDAFEARVNIERQRRLCLGPGSLRHEQLFDAEAGQLWVRRI